MSAGSWRGVQVEAYTSFAYVYDTFMDNVPYGEWARHIREKLCEHGVTDGIVLDSDAEQER